MWNLEIRGFSFYFLFYNFMLYSFFGWIWESCFVSVKERTWVNRGFLNGPVIPLYGSGATLVYVLIAPIQERPAYVFVGGMLVATVLEYITSYVMEKLFHAKWWDYSNYHYQFRGRICLLASLFWGFLSILLVDVLQPAINLLIAGIPRRAGDMAGIVIGTVFIADMAVTIIYTVQWDKKLADLERIREEFMEYAESTRLYETRKEMRERLEALSPGGYVQGFRAYIEELAACDKEKEAGRFQRLSGKAREELAERMESMLLKYRNRAEQGSFVEKRLIKAFPTMKIHRSPALLKDIRALKDKRNGKH